MANVDAPAPPKLAPAAPLLNDPPDSGAGKWLALAAALLGWMFDGAANVGYLLVGFAGLALLQLIGLFREWLLAAGLPESTVEMLVRNNGWRLMMLLGTVPAILTFFIRLFVPESEKWEKEQASGN